MNVLRHGLTAEVSDRSERSYPTGGKASLQERDQRDSLDGMVLAAAVTGR
jgi:hypothetical protein